MPEGGSQSKRQMHEDYERNTGKRAAELDENPCPPVLLHVWEWFVHLDAARVGGGFAPGPLTFSEIDAYFCLMNIDPVREEISCLLAADRARLETLAKKD